MANPAGPSTQIKNRDDLNLGRSFDVVDAKGEAIGQQPVAAVMNGMDSMIHRQLCEISQQRSRKVVAETAGYGIVEFPGSL